MSAVGNKSFIQDGFIVLTADLKNCLYFALKSPVVGFLSAKYKKKKKKKFACSQQNYSYVKTISDSRPFVFQCL